MLPSAFSLKMSSPSRRDSGRAWPLALGRGLLLMGDVVVLLWLLVVVGKLLWCLRLQVLLDRHGLGPGHMIQGRIAKGHAGSAGLTETVGLPRQGYMAVVRRREHGVVLVRCTHAVLGWRRSKTAPVKGSFVGQRRRLHLLQAQRRRRDVFFGIIRVAHGACR